MRYQQREAQIQVFRAPPATPPPVTSLWNKEVSSQARPPQEPVGTTWSPETTLRGAGGPGEKRPGQSEDGFVTLLIKGFTVR